MKQNPTPITDKIEKSCGEMPGAMRSMERQLSNTFLVVRLTGQGCGRVLDSSVGMTFPVNAVTDNGNRRIVHVRDYRYDKEHNGFALWTLEPEHYEWVKP